MRRFDSHAAPGREALRREPMARAVRERRRPLTARAVGSRLRSCSGSPRHAVRCVRGFTLVEMVVVIAVILVLLALTVTVGVSVVRASEARETQNLLTQLDGIVQEWQLASGRTVRYGRNNTPCDNNELYELEWGDLYGSGEPDENDPDHLERTVDELLLILMRNSEVRDMIARINPEFVSQEEHQGEMFVHIHDSWGNLIYAVLPGRDYGPRCSDGLPFNEQPSMTRDPDGTIRTPFENRFGVCDSRTIYFVSAGPDGEFGDLHLNIEQATLTPGQLADIKKAQDNIYSGSVLIEQARPKP